MLNERHVVSGDAFVEMVVWQLPSPIEGCRHRFKYRIALIVQGECVLRYDNERGQGNHKHFGENRVSYDFTTPKALLSDFWKDVENRRS